MKRGKRKRGPYSGKGKGMVQEAPTLAPAQVEGSAPTVPHLALCPCDACVQGSRGCNVCRRPTPFAICVRCSLDILHKQLEIEGYYTRRREEAYKRLQGAGLVQEGMSVVSKPDSV